ALPVCGSRRVTLTRTLLPYVSLLVLTELLSFGATATAAAALTTVVTDAAAAGVAANWPAPRQRPRDSAMVPVPDMRRRRLELRSCTVETSLRHACEVSCRVRAGRLPGHRQVASPRGPRVTVRTATAERTGSGSPVP